MERRLRVTRSVLEVLDRFEHPVGIVTKSALVARDLDILVPMARRGLAAVAVSVTTLDPELSRRLEPRAPAPARRLETVRALAEAGVPARVLVAPIIPAINDSEIEAILEAVAEAGARGAGYVMLRLPLEIAGLFRNGWTSTTRTGPSACSPWCARRGAAGSTAPGGGSGCAGPAPGPNWSPGVSRWPGAAWAWTGRRGAPASTAPASARRRRGGPAVAAVTAPAAPDCRAGPDRASFRNREGMPP